MTRSWHALVAPIDVPDSNGRFLATNSTWQLRDRAPLMHDQAKVGEIDAVSIETRHLRDPETGEHQGPSLWLTAYGTVDTDELADRMHRRELRPQLELWHDAETELHALSETDFLTRYDGGTVAAIALGDRPAWPDVHFVVDR